jgi:hypothetical protein
VVHLAFGWIGAPSGFQTTSQAEPIADVRVTVLLDTSLRTWHPERRADAFAMQTASAFPVLSARFI